MSSVKNTLADYAAEDALRKRLALISLIIGFFMLVLKIGSYLVSGSTAILSDAMESVAHVIVVSIMYSSLKVMLQPPDDDHPYGHGRAEHFSVALEGALVALAGVSVLVAVSQVFYNKNPVSDHPHWGWGLAGISLAMCINLALGISLLVIGKRTKALILIANGHHVLSDVWTSFGVLLGVSLVWLTNLWWIDPLVAVVLAFYLIFTGMSLVRQAATHLMDQADLAALGKVVEAINSYRDPAWIDVHNLRLRVVGDLVHVDFHLVVPGDWTVSRGHDAMDLLEHQILKHLGVRGGTVLIHLDEPEGPGHKHDPAYSSGPFSVAHATRVVLG